MPSRRIRARFRPRRNLIFPLPSPRGFGMTYGMNKAKIVKSWASLGDARPRYDEFDRAMTRPVRMNRYGFVDAMEILDWMFREEYCCEYFRLRHRLCSLRVAKLKAVNMLAAWREKYANEITERTKKRWWRRMLKRMREKGEGVEANTRKVRTKAA